MYNIILLLENKMVANYRRRQQVKLIDWEINLTDFKYQNYAGVIKIRNI